MKLCLLQLNMAGYSLVLPDMIGGNGYDNIKPDKEIFLRWLQANTFMPSIQFSFVPWDHDAEVKHSSLNAAAFVGPQGHLISFLPQPQTVAISHKFVDLHEKFSPYIMERFKLAVARGEPVNPPIWWISPEDKTAQTIDDEFLLGEKILAAPVVQQGELLSFRCSQSSGIQ